MFKTGKESSGDESVVRNGVRINFHVRDDIRHGITEGDSFTGTRAKHGRE